MFSISRPQQIIKYPCKSSRSILFYTQDFLPILLTRMHYASTTYTKQRGIREILHTQHFHDTFTTNFKWQVIMGCY